jgi:acyl-CoA synthetase (AMP-forming)/AMP-acid ligase II/acyl carrier protein
MLLAQSERAPRDTAIEAPGRPPLSYAAQWQAVNACAGQLRGIGIQRQDRVAVCLPNGPEMAVAFLTIGSVAVCAPLNPEYREREFEFFLSDLQPKAILLLAGQATPARPVAERLGIRILEIETETAGPAGTFRLAGMISAAEGKVERASDGDVALILHTSGTTSRPKMVPLTHGNLCASAENVKQALALTPTDRCLNVMPLFHIHGLVAAVLASLSAGGCVICTPGFYAPSFFDWIRQCRPTWYTAVPTMHQAILARAAENLVVIRANPLRLIRSSSASLPPQVLGALEKTFGAPVVEAYGMTEAAHQMASNPLGPPPRKPGSVGLAAGPDVGIMDDEGRLLLAGERGEVVIRGANVTQCYLNNAEANARAFVHGWFRTGDQGYFDAEGYLFLTGRLKEIINRGGEKIAPREIDEVLLDHPAVAQAVAFAMPDPRLGEDVAAAVVLREGRSATERQLREFAAVRLADFKVPRRIMILDTIPTGPTGKLQRIGLGETLGLTSATDPVPTVAAAFVAPYTRVEVELTTIWQSVLGHKPIGMQDHFLDVGGDSLQATMIAARVREHFGISLSLLDMLDAPTVEEQAHIVEQRIHAAGSLPPGSDP